MSEPSRATGAPAGAPAAAGAVEAALDELGLPYESPQPGSYLVRLEGQHKLATMTWLIVGAHSLAVEAFFCRQPDENQAAFYRFLLERSGRMYGVHFSLDPVGDVYLTGRLPLSATSPAEIDRLLGCVLSYSDDNFDAALELGFASSIRREWAWRAKRGESLANLRAFARFADPQVLARGDDPPEPVLVRGDDPPEPPGARCQPGGTTPRNPPVRFAPRCGASPWYRAAGGASGPSRAA